MFSINKLTDTVILPYNVESYQELYAEEFITSFTHSALAEGPTDLEMARKFTKQLNEAALQAKLLYISFNDKMFKGNVLKDGACSAIVFRVAKEAIRLHKFLNQIIQLKPSSRESSFGLHFARYVFELESMATGGNKEPAKSEQKMIRTEQMALNMITVNRNVLNKGNAVAEKVGAMAPFYGLKVVESSSELRVKKNEQLQVELSQLKLGLIDGVYILRIIQEEYNHKLEVKGHSILYIKRGEAEYYFDPALGCYRLFAEVAKTNLIYNALLSANERFGVDTLSFHRLVDAKHSDFSSPNEGFLNISKGEK